MQPAPKETWWIRDKNGSVVGPVEFEVIDVLVQAGELRGRERVSRNQREWMRAPLLIKNRRPRDV